MWLVQNAYDFDKTIYYDDSTRDFYFFCLKRHWNILLYLPYQLFWFILFATKVIRKTAFKEKFYIFFRGVKDIDGEVATFWKEHEKKIKPWYLEQKRADDVIISASPEFLLRPICEKLGVRLIASRVDQYTGAYDGENCYGEEKVLRYQAEAGEPIEKFYSDSLSDTPMAHLAKEAYIVQGDAIIPWQEYHK